MEPGSQHPDLAAATDRPLARELIARKEKTHPEDCWEATRVKQKNLNLKSDNKITVVSSGRGEK